MPAISQARKCPSHMGDIAMILSTMQPMKAGSQLHLELWNLMNDRSERWHDEKLGHGPKWLRFVFT
jgi:hypothetical protein